MTWSTSFRAHADSGVLKRDSMLKRGPKRSNVDRTCSLDATRGQSYKMVNLLTQHTTEYLRPRVSDTVSHIIPGGRQ